MKRLILSAFFALALTGLPSQSARAEGFHFGFHCQMSSGCCTTGIYYANHPCTLCCNPYGFPPYKYAAIPAFFGPCPPYVYGVGPGSVGWGPPGYPVAGGYADPCTGIDAAWWGY
jgi:hypothetical protein